jgi:hypothetical protein
VFILSAGHRILTLAFLDEDDLTPADGPASRHTGPERQRQILVRRVIALGIGILVVILLLLAVRGCLNARKERGFENYVSDLTTIVQGSNQLSDQFFGRLQDPSGDDSLELEAQIASARGTAQQLYDRVVGLDTPDELSEGQADLELAFELRRDGIAGVATDLSAALGNEGRSDALDQLASDMRAFLASDVLYERGVEQVTSVLDDEGIAHDLSSQDDFLPDESWLDTLELTTVLSACPPDSPAARGVHGLELVSTTVEPAGIELVPGSENTASLDGDTRFEVDVVNGGDAEERDVVVEFELSGIGEGLEGRSTIPSLDAGGTQTVAIELGGEPETGVPLSLEITALPVPCEAIVDNNLATYTLTFED